jgi:hypothetical protein
MSNYKILVSVKNIGTPPMCKWPREIPRTGTIRGYSTMYYNNNDLLSKQIIYPKRYCLKIIEENDPLELDLIKLKDMWPDWYVIQVF